MSRTLWEHEDKLLNQRLTWLMASQALLFVAYGGVPGAGEAAELRNVIPPLGVAINGLVLLGTLAAIVAQVVLRVTHTNGTGNRLLVSMPCTVCGWITAIGIPASFLTAWMFVW